MRCTILLLLFSLFFGSFGYSKSSSRLFLIRILNNSETVSNKSVRRLSSARLLLVDDPANYAIYEKLESFVRSTNQLISGDEDMINYYRFMQGALSNTINMLQRIRVLVLKKSSVYTSFEKEIVDTEIKQYQRQILYNLKNSQFNKKSVFNSILNDKRISSLFINRKYNTIAEVDALLKYFIYQRSVAGLKSKKLSYRVKGKNIQRENTIQTQSRKGDLNYASEISQMKAQSLKTLIQLMFIKR